MHPDCTCVNGVCAFHQRRLFGKILQKYLTNAKFAAMIDAKLGPGASVPEPVANPWSPFSSKQQRPYNASNRPKDIPNQLKPSPPRIGWGDRVTKALAMAGITEQRVESWLGHPCGCAKRREMLNQFGYWVSGMLSGKATKEQLEEMMQGCDQ